MSASRDWARHLRVDQRDVAHELERIFVELVDARGVLTTLEGARAVLPVRPSEIWDAIDSLADAVYAALRTVQREALS